MFNELNHLRIAIHTSSFVVLDFSVQIFSFFSSLDSQIAILMQLLLIKKLESRSKKLSNISKYDEDEFQLNAWEQSLIQRMHINNDRYSFEQFKIAYEENRLTIEKKAHNLMNSYRVDDLCILIFFVDWRFALRRVCDNSYEQKNARKYLRETLKQRSMSFEKYYNLFFQKKNRFKMKNASLIDAMKFNVSYFTQAAVLMYRVSEINQRSITFDEHVTMWLETNRELRQIRHVVLNKSLASNIFTSRKEQTSQAFSVKELMISLASASVSIAMMLSENSMNLSSIMTAIKDQSLKTHEIRKICENWKLCFYCK
jgi:hypothetical protein